MNSFIRIIIFLLGLTLFFLPAYSFSGEVLWGDINQDGKVTAVDAMLLRQHLNGLITLPPENLVKADADRNNKLEHADADFIDLIIVGANQDFSYINGNVYGVNGERFPLEGALIELVDRGKFAYTDSNGEFHLQVPGAGFYKIHISKEGYSFADRNCQVVADRDFWVEDVYLTALDSKVTEIGDEGGTHINEAQNLEVIVPPGAVTQKVREQYAKKHKLKSVPKTLPFRATWYEENSDLPGPLPSTSVFTYASLHEPDVEFDTSVTVRVKNVKGFRPNTPIPYAFWNSETQQWEGSHLGYVSADGKWVIFEVGHFSPIDWNLVPNNPINPPNTPNTYPPINSPCRGSGGVKGSPFISTTTGHVTVNYDLPSFRVNSIMHRLGLTYNSATASPTHLIGADIDWTKSCQIGTQLQLLSFRLQIEGRDIWRKFVVDCNQPSKIARHGIIWDCRNARGDLVDTGLYRYEVTVAHHFGGHYWWTDAFGARPIGDTGVPILIEDNPYIPVKSEGIATVINQRNSSFGAGWTMSNLPQLFRQPYSTPELILITWGNLYNEIFVQQPNVSPKTYISLSPNKNKLIDLYTPPSQVKDYDNLNQYYLQNGSFYLKLSKTGDAWVFNRFGLPILFKTSTGVTVYYIYDNDNRLIRIIYPPNKVVEFAYDSAGYISSITDPAGRITQLSVDSAGNLRSITDPSGNTTTYEYDSEHRLISESNPSGDTTTIEYDGYSRARIMREADGAVHKFFPEEVQNTIDDYPPGQGDWYNPDMAMEVPATRYIDPRGNTWQLKTTINQAEKLFEIRRTFPSGSQFAFVYDYEWKPLSFTSLLGATYKYTYDNNSNLTEVKNLNSGQTFKLTWASDFKKITSIIDPDGNIYRFQYDSVGNLIELIRPGSGKTRCVYDSLGKLIRIILPNSATLNYYYDNAGNLTTIVDPEGNSTHFTYDSIGRATSITDALGNIYQIGYNSGNRIVSFTDQAGNSVYYQYDKNYNLIQTTDRNGKVWKFDYDSRNRLCRLIHPSGAQQTFEYDGNNNLTRWINANGGSVEFSYAPDNEPSNYVTSDKFRGFYHINYSGRNISLLNEIVDEFYEFDYDGVQTRSRTTIIPINTAPFELNYQHNGCGKRTACIDSFGTQNYKYNPDGALIEITDTNGTKIEIQRDVLNRIAKIIYPNGITTEYTYSPVGYVTQIQHYRAKELIARVTSKRDKIGNLTEIVYTYNSGTETETRTLTCQYDKRYQLKEFTDTALANVASVNLTYTYNAFGELISDGINNYAYDNAGNLIEKIKISSGEKWKFSYNAANQLIKAQFFKGDNYTTPAVNVEYAYDPIARRVMKKIEDVTTYYIYDGYNLLYEINEEGCIVTRYTHLIGNVIDFPLIAYQQGKRYYYHFDVFNSVYLVSDEQGNIVARYSYTPFGELLNKEGTFHSQFAFTSREIDEETGLMYYRFRYYIPQLGRFTQLDPFALLSGSNLYVYVFNNPLRYVDPLGLQSCGAFPPGTPPISPPNAPPPYNPNQPNPTENTNPNQPTPEERINHHLNELNNWGNIGQKVIGGEYNYGNVAIDAVQNAASEISVPAQVSPGLTVIQAAPTATVGVGVFAHNAATVNAILDLPELNPGKGGGNEIPRPFGLGGR